MFKKVIIHTRLDKDRKRTRCSLYTIYVHQITYYLFKIPVLRYTVEKVEDFE